MSLVFLRRYKTSWMQKQSPQHRLEDVNEMSASADDPPPFPLHMRLSKHWAHTFMNYNDVAMVKDHHQMGYPHGIPWYPPSPVEKLHHLYVSLAFSRRLLDDLQGPGLLGVRLRICHRDAIQYHTVQSNLIQIIQAIHDNNTVCLNHLKSLWINHNCKVLQFLDDVYPLSQGSFSLFQSF